MNSFDVLELIHVFLEWLELILCPQKKNVIRVLYLNSILFLKCNSCAECLSEPGQRENDKGFRKERGKNGNKKEVLKSKKHGSNSEEWK